MQKCMRLTILAWCIGACTSGFSQGNPRLETYFGKYIGLKDEQIKSIRAGTPVAHALPARTPAEVLVFGAVYVNASPESYIGVFRDFARLRKIPGFLAVGVFSSPPKLSDLSGFTFENDDIDALKDCEPADCEVQMPGAYIEDFRKSFDWSSPGRAERINSRLQQTVVERLTNYQRDGNRALGVYNDKDKPVDASAQFRNMLSRSKALPEYLPAFHRYLLDYPKGKPSNTEDIFYWAKVKFGLKPTLRVIHVTAMKSGSPRAARYVIAEKQLYASHYFQTALDLTYCVSEGGTSQNSGFYLIKVMGSTQAGLTGLKGSIVRKVAVSRAVSSLRQSLANIKSALEKRQ